MSVADGRSARSDWLRWKAASVSAYELVLAFWLVLVWFVAVDWDRADWWLRITAIGFATNAVMHVALAVALARAGKRTFYADGTTSLLYSLVRRLVGRSG